MKTCTFWPPSTTSQWYGSNRTTEYGEFDNKLPHFEKKKSNLNSNEYGFTVKPTLHAFWANSNTLPYHRCHQQYGNVINIKVPFLFKILFQSGFGTNIRVMLLVLPRITG